MSLISWFTRKQQRQEKPQESSTLGSEDPTLPMGHSHYIRSGIKQDLHAANRRTERLERRELLYSVVRNCMSRVGVLTSSYKFKVLSLDSHGLHYLIMMDVSSLAAINSSRLSDIEAQIAQNANALYDIKVSAVYWRVNEPVSAAANADTSRTVASKALTAQQEVDLQIEQAGLDLVDEDEMHAFHNALATEPAALDMLNELIGSESLHHAGHDTQFADTQIDDRTLGKTQFSGL